MQNCLGLFTRGFLRHLQTFFNILYLPWRKKNYNLLRRKIQKIQLMLKLQLSMRNYAVWNMFVDSCSLHLYIFLQ